MLLTVKLGTQCSTIEPQIKSLLSDQHYTITFLTSPSLLP
jgi:hypothetical protein